VPKSVVVNAAAERGGRSDRQAEISSRQQTSIQHTQTAQADGETS